DRTLQVLATVPRVSTKAGKTTENQKRALGEFLNFCPVISIEGSKMEEMNVTRMLQQLKKAYVERVVRNGFEDSCLYNDELLKLSDVEINEFTELKGIIGQTKAMGNSGNIDVNNQGLTNEEYEEQEKLEKKKKKGLTDEEKARLEELKKKKKVKEDAISILRGISIRMPLLIYGADIKDEDTELSIDNFTTLVDTQSWEEFMPRGITKQKFNTFKKYYDPEIFSAAGKRIRAMARAADKLTVEERIARIASIFYTFRNPDKETVLTPWKVVNMHMGDCLGGFCFFNEDYSEPIEEPRYIDHGKVTTDVFSTDSYLLEINSKSGLYPLYLTYNIYRTRIKDEMFSPETLEEHQAIWDKAVAENIFVICKTPMAKSITRRTLMGFRQGYVNTRHFEDLINQIKNKPDNFIEKVAKGRSFWKANDNDNMKFKVIVGNPPYQIMDGGAQASATPIYNKFVDIAKDVKPMYISMIMPARWYSGGKGLDSFRNAMINDRHISILHDFKDGKLCFKNVEIKGGICYFLWDKNWNDKCSVFSHQIANENILYSIRFLKESEDDIFIRESRLVDVKNKVTAADFKSFISIVSTMKPYGLRGDFFKSQEKYGLPRILDIYKDNYITIWGLDEKQHRIKKYIPQDYPLPKKDGLDVYKIFIPRNFGSGRLEDNTFSTILAKPNEICTETFIQIYPFATHTEATNCDKYLKTKFVRLLIGIRKQDQGAGRDVYQYIPLQDFTENSNIDWTKSVAEIDAQLYSKYGLSEEEIVFIESMIKPM
ncbi:MAG: Eco57I restriction-modification methylase domain-containing protein, partial [Bacteroidaceae bacterium]